MKRLLSLLCLTVSCALNGFAVIARVGTPATASNVTGTAIASLSISGTNHTTGNLLVVGVNWYGDGLGGSTNPTSATITDTAGNTYTLITSTQTDSHNKSALYYAKNITGNASNVVTVAFTGNGEYASIIVTEYSGANTSSPLDTSRSDNGASSTSVTSGTFTTTSANEVIVAWGHDSGGTGLTFTAGSGYTIAQTSTGGTAAMEDKVVSSIQTGVTAGMSASATGVWAFLIATFKDTSSTSLTCSPITSVTGTTGLSVALTGTATSWTAGTPGTPTFTLSGGTGASITAQVVASTTSANITVNTGSAAASEIITDPSTGATCTIAVSAATGTIYPDDANIVYTGRWGQSGSTTTARAKTINAGSYFDLAVTGATAITVNLDETGLDSTNGFPDVTYIVDNGTPTRTTLSTGAGMSVAVSFPVASMGTHKLRVFAEGITEGSTPSLNQWSSQAGAVILKSITVTTGATTLPIPASPNTMEVLGDSLTASVRQLSACSSTSTAACMAARNGWAIQAGQYLGLRTVVTGFGGQGVTATGSGSVPIANTTFPLVFSGVSYTPAAHPIVIVVATGTNDGAASGATFQTAYTTYLNTIRAAHPLAMIFCLGLPSITHASDISTVVSAVADSRIFYLNYTGLTLTNTDGTHYDTAGAAKLAAKVATDVQAQLITSGISMGSGTGGASTSISFQ